MLKLSAPRFLTFIVSLGLAALALASLKLRIPVVGHTVVSYRTWFLVGAYTLLAIGVISKSL
jgi:hypothetical protein